MKHGTILESKKREGAGRPTPGAVRWENPMNLLILIVKVDR
jgi:hypothetical protein